MGEYLVSRRQIRAWATAEMALTLCLLAPAEFLTPVNCGDAAVLMPEVVFISS